MLKTWCASKYLFLSLYAILAVYDYVRHGFSSAVAVGYVLSCIFATFIWIRLNMKRAAIAARTQRYELLAILDPVRWGRSLGGFQPTKERKLVIAAELFRAGLVTGLPDNLEADIDGWFNGMFGPDVTWTVACNDPADTSKPRYFHFAHDKIKFRDLDGDEPSSISFPDAVMGKDGHITHGERVIIWRSQTVPLNFVNDKLANITRLSPVW